MTRRSRQSFILAAIIATLALTLATAWCTAHQTTLDLFPPTTTTEPR